jgi:glutamate-ammonia-ligase adenylyltransferase
VKLPFPPNLPPELAERRRAVTARLADIDAETPDRVADQLARAVLVSDFVLSVLARRPARLLERLADPAAPSGIDLIGAREPEAMARLRGARQIEMARIACRDLAGEADLAATLEALSALADASIRAALAFASERLAPRYGWPRDGAGRDAPLLVLGMGKLGGRELNFSSDIDLVLLYPDDARLDGADADQTEAYYLRLAQSMIRLLDQATEDGFVFRVDTRLRPFGRSGPLVISVSAFESYLIRHGRDWERYAYVKARLITGTEYRSDVFDDILAPFVFRRYLDYGVFDALREMHRLISREVERKDMADNIKLGPGGIREIEFIVQAFQLVRGGRDSSFRDPNLLASLPRLAERRALDPDAVVRLDSAYRYLRRLENRLQALEDKQTHELPADAQLRARLAYGLGEPNWSALAAQLSKHRAAVEQEFNRVAWDAHDGAEGGAAAAALAAAWETGTIAEALTETELGRDPEAVRALADLRAGGLYRRMDEPSRRRLAELVTRLVPLLAEDAAPGRTLQRLLPIVQAVCRRSAYLALLNENPATLRRLLGIAAHSALLARQVAEHPLLLDELLDARVLESPPTRAELHALLTERLNKAPGGDAEASLEAMRQFQRTAIFRIAVADRYGRLPLMKVSDLLTETAELLLRFAYDMARAELVGKHGRPLCGEPPDLREAGLAVVAYGKLGGLELGYGSDLDLVFVHDSAGSHQQTDGDRPVDNTRFFVRLVQRLIHFLSIQTSSGRLYEIDTRLRPSGGAGLLVTTLDNFRRYQVEAAWTWEHQALLRSRAVAGTEELRCRFEDERRELLVGGVDRARLKDDIVKMRERMRAELSLGQGESFDIKQDAGGLADIEFLIDYWVLANAREYPELVEFPDNIRQLEALEAAGLVPPARCAQLKEDYLTLRARSHELALDEQPRLVPAAELSALRDRVTVLWGETFGPA